MSRALVRSTLNGGAWIGIGSLVIVGSVAAAPVAAPLAGGALVGAGVYSILKGSIRRLREMADEEDGEMFYVYYDLENTPLRVF